MTAKADSEATTLDDAARAGWLYYVGGMTQDQIAREMGVSRQRAQRLVSRAMAERLIHVRPDHKIGACLELETALVRKFGLQTAVVAPGLGAGADPNRAIGAPAARLLERYLRSPDPMIVALGTGRALRAMAEAFTPVEARHHRIVSLIGNIAPDGSATLFDVIMRIAEKLMAPHFPMPVPVISDTPEEREFFLHLRPIQNVLSLAARADVTLVGIGQMGDDAPLFQDGFVTRSELTELQGQGAAGEIVSWVYDDLGRYIETERNRLIGSVRVEPRRSQPVIAVAAGDNKLRAIRGALVGRIVNGLVTDEATATALLQ